MSVAVRISELLLLDARLMAESAARDAGAIKPLSECLESVDSLEGRRRVAEYLQSLPFPHYEPAPDAPGMLVRIQEDGSRTVGRFVSRQFRAADK